MATVGASAARIIVVTGVAVATTAATTGVTGAAVIGTIEWVGTH